MTTDNVTPIRSIEQRRKALELANEIRTYRAKLKQAIREERVEVADILRDPPAEVCTMRVFDLLLSMPKVGRVKANKVFQQTRTSPSKTVDGLTERQREEILMLITPRFRGVHSARQERKAA